MRTRDPNSNSEQTVPMQVRRPTVVMEADPHTETRSYSRCGSNNNGSSLSSPSQRSSGSVRPMTFFKSNYNFMVIYNDSLQGLIRYQYFYFSHFRSCQPSKLHFNVLCQ